MRLPNNLPTRSFLLVGLTAAIGACSLIPGGENRVATAPAAGAVSPYGPQADYPMVLGEAFTVDGQEYVPADTASYDAVGRATIDPDGGTGISIAHRTLPLPSYVELTSLETGRTILARVERRGPMTGSRLVSLSPAAQAQLGSGDGTPVRVRRVNPLESERAELRAGRAVPDRMDTPRSLLSVLARKLPPTVETVAPTPLSTPQPAITAAVSPAAPVPFARAFESSREPGQPAVPASTATAPAREPVPARTAGAGDFVIQAAAFSSEANAKRAAEAIGGSVSQSGRFFRVRTGPYSTRGQAEAALAKVRAAGYSDARMFTVG